MTGPILAALFFTVALLATTAYFILGSIPLLVSAMRCSEPVGAMVVTVALRIAPE